jgi:DnaJ-class molecular chaperone
MAMRRKWWSALLVLFLCAVFTALGALLTCPRCGFEQPEGTTKCIHCGAELPVPPPKVATEAVTPGKPLWGLAADDDWRKSSEAATTRRLWLAWFYARNAYALNMMTEETNSTRAASLVSLMEGYEKRLSISALNCPLCKGTGHADVHVKFTSGRDQVIHSDSALCKFCGGAGTLTVFVRADLLNFGRAQVKREYDALQKDRGRTSLAGLWLPKELTKDLALKDRVQLMRAMGSPCLDCAGLGKLACTKCDGAGWTKCSNMGCESGYVTCPDCGGTGQPTKKSTSSTSGKYTAMGSFCQTCNATGLVICRVCKGAARLSCQACNGRAIQVCKTCNGSGQNPACTQCRGDGTIVCSRCRGAGTIRNAPCTDCNGAGLVLCPTCRGVGRVTRR